MTSATLGNKLCYTAYSLLLESRDDAVSWQLDVFRRQHARSPTQLIGLGLALHTDVMSSAISESFQKPSEKSLFHLIAADGLHFRPPGTVVHNGVVLLLFLCFFLTLSYLNRSPWNISKWSEIGGTLIVKSKSLGGLSGKNVGKQILYCCFSFILKTTISAACCLVVLPILLIVYACAVLSMFVRK